MPFPWSAAISGGSQLLGAGINAIAQGRQNRLSREWSDRAYNREREDSIAFWNMQNEYNSPQAQMARLKEAGLNPMLVYGGSSGGTAGTAGNIGTPRAHQPTFKSPDLSGIGNAGGSAISAFLDYDIKSAQADNLRTQNTVMEQDKLLKAAQTMRTLTGNARDEFELLFRKDLRDVYADAERERVRQIRTSTDVLLNRDEREAIMNSRNVQESVERVLNMRAQRANTYQEYRRVQQVIRNLKKDERLKELDIELREKGVQPGDELWQRIIARYLDNITDLDPVGSTRKWFRNKGREHGTWLRNLFGG